MQHEVSNLEEESQPAVPEAGISWLINALEQNEANCAESCTFIVAGEDSAQKPLIQRQSLKPFAWRISPWSTTRKRGRLVIGAVVISPTGVAISGRLLSQQPACLQS